MGEASDLRRLRMRGEVPAETEGRVDGALGGCRGVKFLILASVCNGDGAGRVETSGRASVAAAMRERIAAARSGIDAKSSRIPPRPEPFFDAANAKDTNTRGFPGPLAFNAQYTTGGSPSTLLNRASSIW